MPSKKERPNKDEFAYDYAKLTYQELVNKYSVSTTLITKIAGEFGLPFKRHAHNLRSLNLSSEQQQIVSGSLLGDGELLKRYSKQAHSRFREGHSPNQYEYIKWKYDVLLPFSQYLKSEQRRAILSCEPTNGGGSKVSMSGDLQSECYVLRTASHKYFSDQELKWYARDIGGNYILNSMGNRTKVVPQDLVLTPLAMAVWYCDDGSSCFNNERVGCPNRRCFFHTMGFTYQECEFLVDQLSKIGIKSCSIVRAQRSGYRISVLSKSFLNVFDIVNEHIPVRCMRHKLGNKVKSE